MAEQSAGEVINGIINKQAQNSIDPTTYINDVISRRASKEEKVLLKSDEKASRLAQKSADQQRADLESFVARNRYVPDRSVGTIAQDTASSLATGVVDVAGTALGLTNLVTGGGVDAISQAVDPEGRAVSQILEDVKGGIRETLDSDELRGMETRQAAQAEFRNAKNKEQYDSEWVRFGANFVGTIGEYASAPGLAVDAVFDSLPQMFVPGAIAKNLVGKLGAKVTAKTSEKFAARYLASDAGKAAITKIQTQTGLSYIAASEGISNGMQIQAEILGASFEELTESSPEYTKLLLQGSTPEDAREQLANKAALITGGISALFGLGAAKISGAGRLEGAMFSMDSKFGKGLIKSISTSKVARGAASEGVEETLQGGSGAFAGNVGKKATVDPEQDLIEGVADATAQGLVVGVASGGGLVGGAQVIGKTAETTKKAAKKVAKKIVETGDELKRTKEVREIIKRNDVREVRKVRDIKDDNYKPDVALEVALETPPKNTTDLPRYVSELNDHFNNVREDLQARKDKIAEVLNADPKDKAALAGLKDLAREEDELIVTEKAIQESFVKIYKESKLAKLSDEEIISQVNAANKGSDVGIIKSFFGSMSNFGNKTIQNVIDTGKLDADQKAKATQTIQVNDAMKSDQVSKEIVEGSRFTRGLKEYRAIFDRAVQGQSEETFVKTGKQLAIFTKRHTLKGEQFQAAVDAIENGSDTQIAEAVKLLDVVHGWKMNLSNPNQITALKNTTNSIQSEIQLANAVLSEARAGYKVAFGKAASGEQIPSVATSATAVGQGKVGTPARPAVLDAVEFLRTQPNQKGNFLTYSDKKLVSLNANHRAKIVARAEALKASAQKTTVFGKAQPSKTKVDAASDPGIAPASREIAASTTVTTPPKIKDDAAPSEADLQAASSQTGDPTKEREASSSVYSRDDSLLSNSLTAPDPTLFKEGAKNPFVKNFLSTVYKVVGTSASNMLQSQANFFSEFRKGNVDIKLDDIQTEALAKLSAFEKVFVTALTKGFTDPSTGKFSPRTLALNSVNKNLHQLDLMKLWLDDNGNLDENMASQMALVAYAWMRDKGTSTIAMTVEDINRALGRHSKEQLTNGEIAAMKDLGQLKSAMAAELGQAFMATTNLQFDDKNAPTGFDTRMDLAIGQTIMTVMLQMNLIKTNTIAFKSDPNLKYSENFADLSEEEKTQNDPKAHYVRIIVKEVVNDKGYSRTEPSTRNEAIVNKTNIPMKVATTEVMESMFNTASQDPSPATNAKDIKKTPETVKKTGTNVPQEQRTAMDKHNQFAVAIKTAALSVLEALTNDNVLNMLGFVPNIDTEFNSNERESLRAKNRQLNKDISGTKAWVEELRAMPEGEQTEFFHTHKVGKNQRMTMEGTTANMQQNKVARSIFGMADHEVTISSKATVGNELLENFFLASAEFVGIKLLKANNLIIQEVTERMSNEIFAPAVTAAGKILDGKALTEADQLAMVEAVKEGGEGLHTMEVITAWAAYQAAAKTGADFTTTLSREVDGISNGVIIAMIQLQPDMEFGDLETLLNRGGVFFDKNEYSSYADYLEKTGATDMYITLAGNWVEAMNSTRALIAADQPIVAEGKLSASRRAADFAKSNPTLSNLGLLQLIDGTIGFVGEVTRDVAKNPLMVFVYGGGIKGITASLTKKTIGQYYSDISAAYKLTLSNDVAIRDAGLAAIDELSLKLRRIDPDAIQLTTANALHFTLTNYQTTKLGELIEDIYGPSLDAAFDKDFRILRARRDALNGAITDTYDMFKLMFDDAVTDKTAELGRALTPTEIQEIRTGMWEASPLFNTPLTGTTDNSGFMPIKDKSVKNSDIDYTNRSVAYGKGNSPKSVIRNTESLDKDGKGVSRLIDSGRKKEMDGTGVAGAVGGTQAIDASIITGVMGKFAFVNVHDAVILGLANVPAGTEAVNKEFTDQAFGYDMPAEVMASLAKTLEIFRAHPKFKEFSAQMDVFNDKGKKTNGFEFIEVRADEFRASSEAATKARKELTEGFMKNGRSVQYDGNTGGWEGSDTLGSAMTEAEVADAISDLVEQSLDSVKELGSSDQDFDINSFEATSEFSTDPLEQNAQTPHGIFNILAGEGNVQETVAHTKYLSGLLDTLITRAIAPLKVKMQAIGNTTQGLIVRREETNESEVFLINAAEAQVHGLQMSSQATFVHELIHAVTMDGIDADSTAKRELVRLYRWAKETMKPSDFLPEGMTQPSQLELDAAQAQYDYIFNNEKSRTVEHTAEYSNTKQKTHRSNFLHEFMAVGMTNEAFRKALSKYTPPKSKLIKGDNILEVLMNLFNRLIELFDRNFLRLNNLTADQKLLKIANHFADIEQRKQQRVALRESKMQMVDRVSSAAIVKLVIDPLVKLAESDKVQKSKSGIVRETGKLVSNIRHGKSVAFFEAVLLVRKRAGKTARTFLNSLAREIVGVTENSRVWHAMLSQSGKLLDQNHKAITTQIAKDALSAFDNLTEGENHSLNLGFMKADMSHIFGRFTHTEIAEMLGDNSSLLASKIAEAEAKLTVPKGLKTFYLAHTASMATMMMGGRATEHGSYRNAHNIANAYNTALDTSKVDLAAMEAVIEDLGTFYAMREMSHTLRTSLATVIVREDAKGFDSGMNFLSEVLSNNKEQSLEKLFNNKKALMAKGYTKDTYDPNVVIEVAPLAREAELLREGFARSEEVIATDSNNPMTEPMYIYVNYDGKAATFQSGIMSTKQMRSAGTDLLRIHEQAGRDLAALSANLDVRTIQAAHIKAASDLVRGVTTNMPADENPLIPIFSEEGKIAGYRYMMLESTKNRIMNKDNSFEKTLGNMEAGIQDKVNGKYVNKKVVEELKKEYDSGFIKGHKSFVFVGENSQNAEFKEMWQLMPSDARRHAEETFGEKGLFIRDDIVDLVFGRRKFTVMTGINKKYADLVERELLGPIALATAERIKNVISTGAKVWPEIVRSIKDTIVIKTFSVLKNNVISNHMLLTSLGVPQRDIIVNSVIAIKRAKEYQKGLEDAATIKKQIRVREGIKARQSTTTSQKVALDGQISGLNKRLVVIREALATNPVRELNEEGVYQTIVEDVEMEDDSFSYKSKLENWTDPVLSKVPGPVKTLGRHLFMTHGSPAYKFLRDATQLSDFVARFTLHEHNKAQGMSKADSVQKVITTFINYDLPTHQSIQWANDVGLIMFTKFALRIQRVILSTVKGKPATALALLTLQDVFGDVSDITESVLTPMGVLNRFNTDPFELLFTGISEGVGVKYLNEGLF